MIFWLSVISNWLSAVIDHRSRQNLKGQDNTFSEAHWQLEPTAAVSDDKISPKKFPAPFINDVELETPAMTFAGPGNLKSSWPGGKKSSLLGARNQC